MTRLLIIRPGALGDTLLTFPVIEALRSRHSNPSVTLVGNKAALPLAQALGLAETVSNYDEPLWSGLFATIPNSTARGHSHLYGNRSLREILSEMDEVVAWLSDPDHCVYQNVLAAGVSHVTVAPGRPSAQERIHIVDYLARSVDVSTNPYPYYGGSFSVARDIPSQAQAFAVHPGSGGAYKCWPTECFAEVIHRLWQQNWSVLLLGGPADHERLAAVLQLLPEPPQPAMLRLLVDMPLLDLVPILCQCRGYLGNDAGMTHLAALLGLPTFAIFGPTDPFIWRPRGRSVKVIYEPDLKKLAVDVVMAHILTG